MMSSMWMMTLLLALGTARGDTCDSSVLECIKKVNGAGVVAIGKTFVQILRTKDYSVTWHSKSPLELFNISCITTEFTPTKSRDTYWIGCEKVKDISYSSKMDFRTKVLSIDDYYDGISMRAHVVYVGSQCIALYVCSPNSDEKAHIKVYCPSSGSQADFSQDLQSAQERLNSCTINDGVPTCTQKCS